MNTFKSFVRVFISSPSVQQKLRQSVKKTFSANSKCGQLDCFSKPSEREPMVVNSLTKVSNFLNVSAQQRKVVRFTISPQVTQHRIWIGALQEVLNGLKSEMDCLSYEFSSIMGQQIISSCLKFLADTDNSLDDKDDDPASWMRLAPAKRAGSPSPSSYGSWDDVLEMFNDLIQCTGSDKDALYHVRKLEAMKEGLAQIKDVLINRSIGYKEARYQESQVRKKLSSTLGHSSRCLFTLLLYYLYGQVRDIEVDVRGGIYGDSSGNKFRLCLGRILTSGEEEMVWNGVKQLDRALGLFKFVWETAGMKGVLEPQGHLWCIGAEHRTLNYRQNLFFVHGISL